MGFLSHVLSFQLPFISYSVLLFLKALLVFYRARAIRFRQDNNEAVGGFFSQIGQLYMVHHLWGKLVYVGCFFLTQSAPNRLLTLPRRRSFSKRQRNVLLSFFFYINCVDFLYFYVGNFTFKRSKQKWTFHALFCFHQQFLMAFSYLLVCFQ